MDKESIRITGCTCGSSCLCGEPSKPKLNLKAARQQQEQKQKRQQQEQLQQQQVREQQQQVREQQHQECQCNLLVDCRDQTMQFPPNEKNRIDKSNDPFECSSTQMSFINTQHAKINVLIMNGSNVPTYYNSSDHHQGDISEICVLESDLAHESAKFLDFDTPTFTMCRTNDPQDNNGKRGEGATEVLLMGTTKDQTDPTTSEDCNNSPSMIQDPQANDEQCQELIKRQEARLLELEELLLQQQKLHQSIQTKMNELQSPKKEEPRPKAGGTTVKTMARMTQTIGRSMKK
ncbi:hypothetical protein KR215_002420 [Drosophila sulfurigaster]|nr:hypothetical protein KR215_002420 [Drosophila sulfurigaster]